MNAVPAGQAVDGVVAIGFEALKGAAGTQGGTESGISGTVAIGDSALLALTTGAGNVAVGYLAMSTENTGGYSTAVGYKALKDQVGVQYAYNTAMGFEAGLDISTGEKNVMIGSYALGDATSDVDDNVAVGHLAMGGAIGAEAVLNCVAIGSLALDGALEEEVSGTVAIGKSALTALTSGAQNTAVGYNSLPAVTTTNYNTALGYNAGQDCTGSSNVYIGRSAGRNVVAGEANVVIGMAAMDDTTAGSNAEASSNNVFIGYLSGTGGWANTQTDNCVAIGSDTMKGALDNVDGTVAIGRSALAALTSGAGNVAVGYQAGNILTTGSTNTIIGHDADVDANSRAGCIVIGSGLSLNTASDNVVEIGNNTNSMTYDLDGGDITVTSDVRTKKNIKDTKLGLEFINKLRPITYQTKSSSQYPKEFDIENPSKKSSGKTWDGLIAQEVKEVMDEMEVGFSGWAEGINTKQRLAYGKFVMPLIKAVQELTAKVEALENA
jgi:hypothetical protein